MNRNRHNIFTTFLLILSTFSCKSSNDEDPIAVSDSQISLTIDLFRQQQPGFDLVEVVISASQENLPITDGDVSLTVSSGSASEVSNHGDGTYSSILTPASTGEINIAATVNKGGLSESIERTAIILDTYLDGVGQPMAIPGDFVNTEGYEDGATITPDGQYLFVQYGPFYFSGILNFSTICSDSSYAAAYNLNDCNSRENSDLVFNTIGPYGSEQRPDFPTDGISEGRLLHLDGIAVPSQFNGIVSFPTVFYGFKRQSDGSFAEPFKLAFNDPKGVNGPFGPSFISKPDGTYDFVIAWNNYFDGDADGGVSEGEDDKPDIYYGNATFGSNINLGEVTFNQNDTFASITPNIVPVGFPSHSGVQGNPHVFQDSEGLVTSIWTDDEQVSHDISVYQLVSGTFPTGSWQIQTLPSKISTSSEESQPFFTGTELIFRRGTAIVSHAYQPNNGSCGNGFASDDCWGDETILLGANGNSNVGEIFTVGEPTIATWEGKRYLYFVYVLRRENSEVSLIDWNVNVGFVELP